MVPDANYLDVVLAKLGQRLLSCGRALIEGFVVEIVKEADAGVVPPV